jgi:hypothetical protein
MLNRCFLSGTGEGCDDDGLELDASRRSMDDGFDSSTGNGSRISSKDRAVRQGDGRRRLVAADKALWRTDVVRGGDHL